MIAWSITVSSSRVSIAKAVAVTGLSTSRATRVRRWPERATGRDGVMLTLAAPINNWLATDSIANESTPVKRQAVSKIRLRVAGLQNSV